LRPVAAGGMVSSIRPAPGHPARRSRGVWPFFDGPAGTIASIWPLAVATKRAEATTRVGLPPPLCRSLTAVLLLPLDRDVPAHGLIELGEHARHALSRRCLVAVGTGRPLDELLRLKHRLFFHGRPVAQDQTRQRNPRTALDVPLLAPLVIDARRQDGWM